MRSLHILKTSVGAAWAVRQVRELQRLGADCHVALPAGGVRVEQLRDYGAVVHEVDLSFPVGEPRRVAAVLRQMRRLADDVRPDVIHSHFVSTTLTMRLALGRMHRTPRIFQVPGPLHLESPFFRSAEIRSAGPADYWIGSCRWTVARYLKSGIPSSRICLSYYGTDTESFDPSCPGKLRSEIGVDNDTPLVGIVSYMYPPKRFLGQSRGIKGHEDLFQAMKLCRATNESVRLVVIGGAWGNAHGYEAKLRARGNALLGDSAIFMGSRTDVPLLYPDLDVAVHPSHSENVGGAVESLLAGVPTVATAVGGLPDLVIPGRTGWLVPPRSPQALALAISEAIEGADVARAYARSGRALAMGLFDVRQTAVGVLDAYERVLRLNEARFV